jgi:hypothetical protein
MATMNLLAHTFAAFLGQHMLAAPVREAALMCCFVSIIMMWRGRQLKAVFK